LYKLLYDVSTLAAAAAAAAAAEDINVY